MVRLQSYQGSEEEIAFLSSNSDEPIVGLLTADDGRQSYYLNESENKYIYAHDELQKDGLVFISTDVRVEYIDDINSKIDEFSTATWNNQLYDLVVFTHEWALNYKTMGYVEELCDYAFNQGYSNVFFEDLIDMGNQ